MRLKNVLATVVAVGALGMASAAQAVTYQLNDGGSAFTGLTTWGSVTLTDTASNTVQVVVDLVNGYHFVDTGAHEYFSFNTGGINVSLVGGALFTDPSSSATKLTNNPGDNSPFASFQYAIACATCSEPQGGGGSGNNNAGNVLTFSVTGTGLTSSSFAHDSTGTGTHSYFAADIMNANGGTGVVGTVCDEEEHNRCGSTTVPEPATLGLLGLGLAGIGFSRRRKVTG